jgi:hypothetical protein
MHSAARETSTTSKPLYSHYSRTASANASGGLQIADLQVANRQLRWPIALVLLSGLASRSTIWPIEQHCQPDSIRLRGFNETMKRGSQKT